MWIIEYTCELRIAVYYCWILNSQFLNVFKSMCWTHESQLLNFATNKRIRELRTFVLHFRNVFSFYRNTRNIRQKHNFRQFWKLSEKLSRKITFSESLYTFFIYKQLGSGPSLRSCLYYKVARFSRLKVAKGLLSSLTKYVIVKNIPRIFPDSPLMYTASHSKNHNRQWALQEMIAGLMNGISYWIFILNLTTEHYFIF